MTFDDIITKRGQATVFSNTDVDTATQNALVDWFFDYGLCTDEKDDPQGDKFLRYFQRNCNLYYPRYAQLLRVLQVKENLDPYVTDYLEEVVNRVDSTTGNSETTRTPDLTRTETTTPTVETTTTRTPNTTDTSVITGGHTDTRTPNTTSTTDTENTSKTDAFGISYPESQLTGVSLDVDVTATRDIDYASSESISGASGVGSSTTTETGTETNQTVYNQETTTNTATGTKTTVVSQSGDDTRETVESGTDTTETSNSGSLTSDIGTIHKGRNESVADIIPRAMKAITGSDAFTWFKAEMKVCFDLYY